MGVIVGGHLQTNALVHAASGHAVQFKARHLNDGDAARIGQPHGLSEAVIIIRALRDIQCCCGDIGAETLHHRIAPHHQFCGAFPHVTTGIPALLIKLALMRSVIDPILRLRGGTFAPQPTSTLATGALRRAFLVRLAHRAATP